MEEDLVINQIDLRDKITNSKYKVLRSTKKQIEGIDYACKALEIPLNMDRSLIKEIFIEVYIEMQIEEKRFHFETENDLPQAKLAAKKIMEPRLKEKLYLKSSEDKSKLEIDNAVDRIFNWYMNTYLKNI